VPYYETKGHETGEKDQNERLRKMNECIEEQRGSEWIFCRAIIIKKKMIHKLKNQNESTTKGQKIRHVLVCGVVNTIHILQFAKS
jgi:hypothetical protein